MHNFPYFIIIILFSDELYSFRTVAKRFSPVAVDISTTNRESTQLKKTTHTRSTVYEGTAVFSTEETFQTIQINTNFLLAGLGAVLIMMLFTMSIELRFSKRKLSAHLKSKVNQTCNETTNRPHHGSLHEMNEHNDTVYNGIDECIELMQPKFSNETGDSEHNLFPLCSNETYFIETKDDDIGAPKNGLKVLLFTESTYHM